MPSHIQGAYVTLLTFSDKAPFVLKTLFISVLFLFSTSSFAISTLTQSFVKATGSSGEYGVYTVSWKCDGYACNIFENSSRKYTNVRGSGSFQVSVLHDTYKTIKIETFNYNPRGGGMVLARTDQIFVEYDAPSPARPSSISVPSSSNTGSISLSWSSSSLTTYYEVLERVNGGNASVIARPTGTSYTRAGRGNNTYSYAVRACNSLSCSLPTSYKSTYVAITPGTPSSISATSLHDGDFNVSWGVASGSVTKYDLDQKKNSGGYTNSYDGSSRSRSYSNLSAGTYKYRVRACRTTGSYTSCSGWRYSGNSVAAKPTAAPGSFAVPSSDSNGAYTVSWGSIGNSSSYTLQERTGTGSWSTIQSSSATSRAISGKGNNTYGYRVRACNDLGCTSYSSEKRIDVAITPGVPSSISATALHDGDFTVSWGSASGSVSKYDLDQSKNNGSYANSYDGASRSKSFSNFSSGTYKYRVRACKTVGSYTSCSGWRTSGNSVAAVPSSAPGSFSIPANDNNGSYTVSWGSIGNSSSYTLQERTGTGSWVTIQNTSAKSRSISGKGNNTYGYRVRACNDLGCTSYSSEKRIDVAITPGVPSSISATALHDGDFTVSWGSASGSVSKYDLDQSKNNGSYANSYDGASRSKSFSNFSSGTYKYRVRACKTVGSYTSCSGWRTSGNSVAAVPSSVPSSFTVPSSDNNGAYSVSWAPVSNANIYTLQERTGSGSWSTIQNTSATNRSISGKGNNTYGYRVRACNDLGCSSYASEKRVDVAIAPAAPSSIAGSVQTGGAISLQWSASSGVSMYQVFESTDNGATYPKSVYSGSSTSKSIADTNVGDYMYRVRACRVTGSFTACSAWRTSGLVTIHPYQISVSQEFTYDALGRLTFVNDSREGMNRDYDYDRVGNRMNVAVGFSDDTLSDSLVPTTPKNLTSTYKGNCYIDYSWGSSDSAAGGIEYVITDSNNETITTTETNLRMTCTYDVYPPDVQAISVKACNSHGCGYSENFKSVY